MGALTNHKATQKLGKMVEGFNDIVEQTFYFEQKVYEWSKKVRDNKILISKSMGRKNRLDVRIDNDLSFGVIKEKDTKIDFYSDQLKQNLDKKRYSEVVNKVLTIDDLSGLIKMLKKYGVPPKEFKKFISSEDYVDLEKIERLIEIGELEIKDLQGCYKAEFNEEIKIRKNK